MLGIDYGTPKSLLDAIASSGETAGDPANSIRRQVAVPSAFKDLTAYIDPGSGQVNPLRWDDFKAQAEADGLREIVTMNGLDTPYQGGRDNARLMAKGAQNAFVVNVYNPTLGGFMKDVLHEALSSYLARTQTTDEVALKSEISDAIQYNGDLAKVKMNPSLAFTDVIGHSEGSIFANLAVEHMSDQERLKINLFDIGTATVTVPTGLNSFTTIMDKGDPVSKITFARFLQRVNPNYWTSGSNYRAVITDIGKVGNDHSFYLYANQPQVVEALHWEQPVEATAPFLH